MRGQTIGREREGNMIEITAGQYILYALHWLILGTALGLFIKNEYDNRKKKREDAEGSESK